MPPWIVYDRIPETVRVGMVPSLRMRLRGFYACVRMFSAACVLLRANLLVNSHAAKCLCPRPAAGDLQEVHGKPAGKIFEASGSGQGAEQEVL